MQHGFLGTYDYLQIFQKRQVLKLLQRNLQKLQSFALDFVWQQRLAKEAVCLSKKLIL